MRPFESVFREFGPWTIYNLQKDWTILFSQSLYNYIGIYISISCKYISEIFINTRTFYLSCNDFIILFIRYDSHMITHVMTSRYLLLIILTFTYICNTYLYKIKHIMFVHGTHYFRTFFYEMVSYRRRCFIWVFEFYLSLKYSWVGDVKTYKLMSNIKYNTPSVPQLVARLIRHWF